MTEKLIEAIDIAHFCGFPNRLEWDGSTASLLKGLVEAWPHDFEVLPADDGCVTVLGYPPSGVQDFPEWSLSVCLHHAECRH